MYASGGGGKGGGGGRGGGGGGGGEGGVAGGKGMVRESTAACTAVSRLRVPLDMQRPARAGSWVALRTTSVMTCRMKRMRSGMCEMAFEELSGRWRSRERGLQSLGADGEAE